MALVKDSYIPLKKHKVIKSLQPSNKNRTLKIWEYLYMQKNLIKFCLKSRRKRLVSWHYLLLSAILHSVFDRLYWRQQWTSRPSYQLPFLLVWCPFTKSSRVPAPANWHDLHIRNIQIKERKVEIRNDAKENRKTTRIMYNNNNNNDKTAEKTTILVSVM